MPVLVLPGFMGSDLSTKPLRHALAEAGFAAHGWGLGMNFGVSAEMFAKIDALALEIAGAGTVALVGWSLGGVVARELAWARPGKVAQVVTLGAPFSGDLRANNAWRLYEWVTGHPVDQPPVPVRRGAKPPVPTTAIWSAKDGIVAAASARGEAHESDRVIEVDCTHLGYMTCPKVAKVVAGVLGG